MSRIAYLTAGMLGYGGGPRLFMDGPPLTVGAGLRRTEEQPTVIKTPITVLGLTPARTAAAWRGRINHPGHRRH